MVFDVESIGLQGEGFAVGYVVVDKHGKELASQRYACDPLGATGNLEAREWVRKNIPPIPANEIDPQAVRQAFWGDWLRWKQRDAALVADYGWPVEARFLAACVDDDLYVNEWAGPYPLYDVSTAMLATGRNPHAAYERLANELPEHDPVADARQSARLWLECLSDSDAKPN